MSQERRKFMRISNPGDECQVRFGGYQTAATVLDESIGGLRLGDLSLLTVRVNQPIVVSYGGETVEAVCRSVTRQASSLFQMGVRRTDAGSLRKGDNDVSDQTMLLNTYMEFGGVDLVCVPVALVDATKVNVMLIDGKRFTVGRDKLFPLSRQERIERLNSCDRSDSILEVYRLPQTDNPFTACDRIVEHEFGPVGQVAAPA